MRYRIARFLQLLGLLILPFGIASELNKAVTLWGSLMIAAGGGFLFYVGYVLQNRA
jgi:hypothetical protein